MGFLFNYLEKEPDYINQISSEELLGKLSINLVEAGDKLHYLSAPDGLTKVRGPEVQNMSSVLCELGRFPKDPESLDMLLVAMKLIATRRREELAE